MEPLTITLMRVIFAANVVVAGTVGALTLFAPEFAARTVFSGAAVASPGLRVTGSLWLAIAFLSLFGVSRPREFAVVLLLQLVYKGAWLLVVALPALRARGPAPFPGGMALFFAVWVLVLPWVIPFRQFFGRA